MKDLKQFIDLVMKDLKNRCNQKGGASPNLKEIKEILDNRAEEKE